MIYPSILDRRYQEYHPYVVEVASRVKSTILNFCEKKGYALTYRIKSIESLAEKIETGRFKKLSDLDDLFACTVIIPTLAQEQEVIEFCEKVFAIIKKVKRGQSKKSPDTFRFDSTRIYAQLERVENISPNNTLTIFDIIFEIQIKSAFEHAWSVSTHALVYKSSEIDWKRLRLAAQIKANVEQLDTLIIAFDQAYPTIQESDYPEIKRKRRLASEIKKLFEQRKIPPELSPQDMTRFCDNLYNIIVKAGKEEAIEEIIKNLTVEIQSTPTIKIPRSISLLQYFFAILVSNESIILPLSNYCCHMTDELSTLYPDLQISVDSVFEYNS